MEKVEYTPSHRVSSVLVSNLNNVLIILVLHRLMIIKNKILFVSSIVAALGLTVLSQPLESFAAEVQLHDCEGNLRATTDLQEGASTDVRLVLPSEEANVSARISNMSDEESRRLKAKDKSLVFGLEGGQWKLCREDGTTLAFNSVEFVESGSESLKVASLVAGSAALVSGLAIASEGSGSSSTTVSNIAEPSQPDRTVTEQPASALNAGSIERPANEVIIESRCSKKSPKTAAARARADGDDCREGEDAPIISPYK